MRVQKWKRNGGDGNYGKNKNKALEFSEKTRKWIIGKPMHFNMWPEQAMLYSNNFVTGQMSLNGTTTPLNQMVKGPVDGWTFDNANTYAGGVVPYMKTYMVGQPVNWPYVLVDYQGTGTKTDSGTVNYLYEPDEAAYNRPDFAHNMLMMLPYLKQYNQGAASNQGYLLQHATNEDIGIDQPEQSGGQATPDTIMGNNQYQHGYGNTTLNGTHGNPLMPYYQKAWCSSVDWKLNYTVTVRGGLSYDEPATWTGGTSSRSWQGMASLPVSNKLRIGLTFYKAIPHWPGVNPNVNNVYDSKRYVSDNGSVFNIDTDFEKNDAAGGSAFQGDVSSPFPFSYDEFWGGTGPASIATKQAEGSKNGPMYKKDYIIKGNTTFSDSMSGRIVPHQFLGLTSESGDKLSYENLAYSTCSDLTSCKMVGPAKLNELTADYLCPAMEKIQNVENGVGFTPVDARDSQTYSQLREKMNFLIGSILQCSTQHAMNSGMEIAITYNLEFERTMHYYHDGQLPTYYEPTNQGNASTATVSTQRVYRARANGWTPGNDDMSLNSKPPDYHRQFWPDNQEPFYD